MNGRQSEIKDKASNKKNSLEKGTNFPTSAASVTPSTDIPIAFMDSNQTEPPSKHTPEQIMQMLKSMGINSSQFKQTPEQKEQEYKFWKTQPVPQFNADSEQEEGIIEPNKPMDEIRKEPYTLPATFEWVVVDLSDEKECKDVYELLTYNYVEDDDALFRFDYTADFLKWGIMPPNNEKSWQLGVRTSESKKLVAFISGIPMRMRLRNHMFEMAEINFLCVHKKLRSKRLAPVLIKEITRRIHLRGIFQAVFTAGALLPKPIATCRYFHRNLNPKKLIEAGFSSLHRNMTMAKTIANYKLPTATSTPGLRVMKVEDIPQVSTLLNEYSAKFIMTPVFTEEELGHWLIPRDKVVYAYVQEVQGVITQLVSFYSLPSSIINNALHQHINAAFLFYHVPKDNGSDIEAHCMLINDALILAKNAGFDVFNCLQMMDNDNFLEACKFGKGDGNLNYYLYNYNLLGALGTDVGLIML